MTDTDLPSPPACVDCGSPTRAVSVPRRVRRGERHACFDGWAWSCECSEADSDPKLFQFVDSELAKVNARLAAEAWQETHGERFPDLRRPGPRRRFTEQVRIRMDPEDVARLEALSVARDQSRSEVVRDLIAEASLVKAGSSASPEHESTDADRRPVDPLVKSGT